MAKKQSVWSRVWGGFGDGCDQGNTCDTDNTLNERLHDLEWPRVSAGLLGVGLAVCQDISVTAVLGGVCHRDTSKALLINYCDLSRKT